MFWILVRTAMSSLLESFPATMDFSRSNHLWHKCFIMEHSDRSAYLSDKTWNCQIMLPITRNAYECTYSWFPIEKSTPTRRDSANTIYYQWITEFMLNNFQCTCSWRMNYKHHPHYSKKKVFKLSCSTSNVDSEGQETTIYILNKLLFENQTYCWN